MARLQEILIGEIAVKLNLITPAQLQECLNLQEKTKPRKPLGLIMIEQNYITKEKLDELLKIQQETIQKKSEEYQRSLQDNLFGRILISKKWVSPENVYDAVREQAELQKRGIKKRLGAILVEKGLLTEEQVKEVLEIQNKKVLYCEKCDTIYTVEWVIGRVYACAKCGARLLVPPKTIIVTDSASMMEKPKSATLTYEPTPKISLPKEELEQIYKKMEERVSKIEVKPISHPKEGQVHIMSDFIKFLLYKPYTLIALIVFIGVVVFVYISLSKKEVEGNIVVELKKPSQMETTFLEFPRQDFSSAVEFDHKVAAALFPLLSDKIENFCPVTLTNGKYVNSETGKLVTPIEAEKCEVNIKKSMQSVFSQLYYIIGNILPVDISQDKELRVAITDFSMIEGEELKTHTFRYKEKEIDVGTYVYNYQYPFSSGNRTVYLNLVWCTTAKYRESPQLFFSLRNEKVTRNNLGVFLSSYKVKLYFVLLPYFGRANMVYGKIIGAELVDSKSDTIKDTFICQEGK
jgi:DNA-directed RNA polymerase subunit RPC12/RpoP